MLPRRIFTERLVLRVPEDGDLEALRPLFTDPVALRHVGTQAVWTEERARRWLLYCDRLHTERGYTSYTVIRKEDGAAVGLAGLMPDENGVPELCLMLMRPYWRRGYMREATAALLARAQRDAEIDRIAIRVEAHHPSLPSIERTVVHPHGFVVGEEAPCPRSGRLMRHYQWLSESSRTR